MQRMVAATRRTYYDAIIDEYGPRRWVRARIGAVIGLLFLSWPLRDAVTSSRPVAYRLLILAAVAAYAVCFLTVIWRNTPRLHGNRAPVTIGLSVLVGSGLCFVYGQAWLTLMTSFTIAMLLFNSRTRTWPYIVVLTPVAEMAASRWVFGDHSWHPLAMGLQAALIGMIQAAFYLQVAAKVELRRVRADLARLAVSEERLRIARDLHDILGQQLSAVSLKAELAARLTTRDPERAAAEMTEVAAVARAALADVRATVAGYRQVSLCGEVETARALLTAARMETAISTCELPAALDACGAWLVREAVTNVIRHAGATRCEIGAVRTPGSAVVEVRDNGGTAGSGVLTFGNGLNGLSERVGDEGGTLWIGREGGWFVVRATFELPEEEPVASESAVPGAIGRVVPIRAAA
jgi:two-component system sensor histidine kinase DesK